jgi:hypothetical protein
MKVSEKFLSVLLRIAQEKWTKIIFVMYYTSIFLNTEVFNKKNKLFVNRKIKIRKFISRFKDQHNLYLNK